ncbi:MAG TPA: 1-deoxy-D-xylulose-5-phosphate reductoisomerase [Thermomicrobiales bacterium]|nr:1-deoxy-D-xylulose-5-phosphate reductoisomerase [Thermomicrobiales bacterium]
MTGIALLGSTGSVGTQTLDVVASMPDRFRIVAMAAGRNQTLFDQQVSRFSPNIALSAKDNANRDRPSPEQLVEAATHPDVDIVVVATSGHDAIPAVIAALEAGKSIALANKEALVCAGALIMPLANRLGQTIRPVDSEHSAVWQSMQAGRATDVRRIILTASGGPFRSWAAEDLAGVTVEQALKHPNWSMGGKITIDSATLMNKGLEVIEAHWLFDLSYDDIDVVVHPESLIHSMVEFDDHSIIAQIGLPNMHLPIQYALTWPEHVASTNAAPLDFAAISTMTFEQPDTDRFPALRIARDAGIAGQTYPTVLSASDEIAVDAFRNGQIGFTDIPAVIEDVLGRHDGVEISSLEDVLAADTWARETTMHAVKNVPRP